MSQGPNTKAECEGREFATRLLQSLVVDIDQLSETVERVRVQTLVLAKDHGIRTAND